MDGTGDMFAPLLNALDPSIRTIIVRYPDEPLDYAAHEKIARAALPAGVPFILLGESFSGPIAVSIAASAPAGLKGLVLCCSFVRSPHRLLGWLKPWLRLLPARDVPGAVTSYFLFGRFASIALQRLHAQTLRRVSSRTLVARLAAIADLDATDALRRAELPTLYLRASGDRLVPRSSATLIERLSPHAQVVEIEGPHLLLQARPAAAAQVLREFAAQLS
jgi:pimeloyl-[acyl-carrier protein] methyl ester esterase